MVLSRFETYPFTRRAQINFDLVRRHFEKVGRDKAPETCTVASPVIGFSSHFFIFEPLGKSARIDQNQHQRLQVFAGALAAFRQRCSEVAAATFDSLAESDRIRSR